MEEERSFKELCAPLSATVMPKAYRYSYGSKELSEPQALMTERQRDNPPNKRGRKRGSRNSIESNFKISQGLLKHHADKRGEGV